MDVAEAAKKYLVYPLMEICRLHMTHMVDSYPERVFAHALRHGYFDLVDKTAPKTLNWNAKEAYETLGMRNFVVWVLYREGWLLVRSQLRTLVIPVVAHKGGFTDCDHWDEFYDEFIDMEMVALTSWKEQFEKMVRELRCSWCIQRAGLLRNKVDGVVQMHGKLASELAKSV
ncbi:hypothetical protein AMATHDRAFT_64334 [Amanita thiersii Skay4041]|uniref:Uncharacterized protein n=1 Tax=Amanita thiersii Skay4041 TaxID=703135 RepID=A0A2A9NMB4_9AGAR|nr:hypothetical protein AMATHDRAFT_64334 [Amanita thiersii Skay4041]